MTPGRRGRTQQGFTLVELLVAMGIASVVGMAILTVTIQTMRTEQFTDQLRTVMDDGRTSLDRVRKELRAARKVYAEETCADPVAGCLTSSTLHFWVDQDQDGDQDPIEQVTYCIQEVGQDVCVDLAAGKKHELVRWTEASSPSTAQVIARTIVGTTTPFEFDVSPEGTSVVTVTFVLDTQSARGPKELAVGATIRLRNVDS
ncbi:MAG: PilW family protein [Nitriliruptorales bacterium]